MNEPDGVACEPGSVIKQPDGTLWVCDDLGWKYHLAPPAKVDPRQDMPNCDPGEMLAWNHKLQTFECISDDPLAAVTRDATSNMTVARAIDPFWIIAIGLAVTIFGVVGMGLSQWWRNRKKKQAVNEPVKSWEDLLKPTVQTDAQAVGVLVQLASEPGFSKYVDKEKLEEVWAAKLADQLSVSQGIIAKEPVMTEPIKPASSNVDAIQKEIAQIMMEIQMGRGELNKIPGMVQVYVNGAMNHFNEAVKKLSALGGMVK
jgi:hypothetical protein